MAEENLVQWFRRLPEPAKGFVKTAYVGAKSAKNIVALPLLRFKKGINVHLGCGDEKKDGYVNIDIRTTVATDYTIDLNRLRWFAPGSVSCFYSHAFFEHLYRTERLIHLGNVHRALVDGGVCCYIGLPYFPNIAKYYLEKRSPGIVGKTFDLYDVYRYTHGDPEHAPTWWLAQLHKSLFDEHELSDILNASALTSHVMFLYCCINEEQWYVNIGFLAKKGTYATSHLQEQARAFLSRDAANKVIIESVRFI